MVEDFGVSISKFVHGTRTKITRLQQQCTKEVLKSIVSGSDITGSQGQPVDTGFLQKSWTITTQGASRSLVSSDVAYAPAIEYNDRAFTLEGGKQQPSGLPHRDGGDQWVKSIVGQNHAVATTMAGWQAIVSRFNAVKIRATDVSSFSDEDTE